MICVGFFFLLRLGGCVVNCFLFQDFTGVPAVVDLACMRDAMNRLGSDSNKINPLVCVFKHLEYSFLQFCMRVVSAKVLKLADIENHYDYLIDSQSHLYWRDGCNGQYGLYFAFFPV